MNKKRVKNSPFCSARWYGFDLDGTIADNTMHNFGMGLIGKPIMPMVNLMKRLHRQNARVKIVTARLNDVGSSDEAQRRLKNHIWRWCDQNLGFRPEITDRKDGAMECLYDDRARQVIRNKGVDVWMMAQELATMLNAILEAPEQCVDKAKALRNRSRRLGLMENYSTPLQA